MTPEYPNNSLSAPIKLVKQTQGDTLGFSNDYRCRSMITNYNDESVPIISTVFYYLMLVTAPCCIIMSRTWSTDNW